MTSSLGRIMTGLREASREFIRECCNATADDQVIFTGSGSTAAINRLVGVLGISIPHGIEQKYNIRKMMEADDIPIICVGPYEHHSNQLPWSESLADIVEIRLTKRGVIDYGHLEEVVNDPKYANRKLKIGSFSAASNV